jgi:hypothetical protein
MDVFKNLTVVRSRSGSVVSDDGLDEGEFCYHQHQNDISDAKMVIDDVDGVVGASNESVNGNSSSLYGRRCHSGSASGSRPPVMAVVTSNKFDSDESFLGTSCEMIYRYQHQKMNERDAILGTLGNDDDIRAFIEALDLKFIILTTRTTDGMEGVGGDEALSEIVFKTRSIFNTTLKGMWREKQSSSSTLGMTDPEESYMEQQHRVENVADHDEYREQHPKTPKNLRMSPMRTSNFNYKNHGFISQSESLDSACSEGSNSSLFRPFKRPRRWFFPQKTKSKRVITPPQTNKKSFPIKAALPKFHFDFGGSTSTDRGTSKKSLMFRDLGCGPKPVHSLQLDGASMGNGSGSASTYMPPTSPIRKVSREMKTNDNNSTAMN